MGRTKSDTDMRMPKYVKTTYAALQKQGLEVTKENIDRYLAELDQKDRDKVYSSVGYAVKAVPDGGKTLEVYTNLSKEERRPWIAAYILDPQACALTAVNDTKVLDRDEVVQFKGCI